MKTKALDHAVRFLRSWLPLRYEREEIPGFAVAIAHRGNVLLNEAYGYADLERKTRLRPDHVFRIASHSKTFTATAVMLLVEEGKLRLEDRAADVLPWLAGHKDRRWAAVTLRQLLSHTGGVTRDGTAHDHWQLDGSFPDRARFQEATLAIDLVVDPNVKMKYSNHGYTLLGLVIEAVAGRPYNDFVEERIVRALGLPNTYAEYRPGLGDAVATGYSRRENGGRLPIAAVDTHAMSAATGFCSTAEDLCAYFTAQMAGSGRLLSDPAKREMQRVHWHAKSLSAGAGAPHQDYGLGMVLEQAGKRHLFGHSGGFPGFITNSAADAADGLVVVALTNCVDGPASTIVSGIYKTIDHFQEKAPDGGAPARDLGHLEGHYTNLWETTSFVALGDGLEAVDPDSWEPFSAVERLEYVDEETFRVADTSSFGSEDERVRFSLRDGRVESVDNTGSTLWPHEVWLQRQAGRTTVGR